MRLVLAALTVLAIVGPASAQAKKGTEVELGGMKSTTPADWKEEALKPGGMRLAQFKAPRAEGDPSDAEIAIFFFKGAGAGTVEQNLKRQEAKFEPPAGKEMKDVAKVEKAKVGTVDATYQDIKGTFLKKDAPFDPNTKVTKMADYRQIYVVFETKEGQCYIWLLGPAKSVEKHKKEFDEWLKNFK